MDLTVRLLKLKKKIISTPPPPTPINRMNLLIKFDTFVLMSHFYINTNVIPIINCSNLYIIQSNTVLSINTETGEVNRMDTATMLEAATEKIARNFRQQQVRLKDDSFM